MHIRKKEQETISLLLWPTFPPFSELYRKGGDVY
jgi:hypothetical protein